MEAVILAAGEGRRLRPLTLSIPKALLKVNGSPLLGRQIDNLRQIGVDTIHIVVGYRGSDIEAFIRARTDLDQGVIFHYQTVLGSSERAFHLAMSHVRGDLVLCLCVDDLISATHIASLRETVSSSADAAFIIKRVVSPTMRGVLVDASRRLVGCSDDPHDPILIYDFAIRTSFYRSLLPRLKRLEQPLVEVLEPTFATNHLAGITADNLPTINTPDDLRHAEKWCQLREE